MAELRDVYGKDGRGFPAPTGEKRWEYDYYEVRRLAKRENLFGRSGTVQGRKVVMLWGGPRTGRRCWPRSSGCSRPPRDTVVTVGTSQFLAGDFLSQDGGGKKPRPVGWLPTRRPTRSDSTSRPATTSPPAP